MLVPVHVGVGWILAEMGRGTRRFRQAVVFASVAPYLDRLFTVHSQSLDPSQAAQQVV